MPPKKTTTADMRAKIAARKKGKASEGIKEPKVTKPKVKTPYKRKTVQELMRIRKEEKAIRDFFTDFVTLPEEEQYDAINAFASDIKAPQSRRALFDRLINQIPDDLLIPFAEEYIAQEYTVRNPDDKYDEGDEKISDKYQTADEFYETFIKRPRNKRRLNTIQQQDIEVLTDRDLNDELSDNDTTQYNQQGLRISIRDQMPGEEPEVLGPKLVRNKTTTKTMSKTEFYDPECADMYKANNLPWINGNVKSVWLSEVDSDLSEFVIKESVRKENGKVWYRTNNKFARLLCNHNASKKVQKEEVLTVYTNRGVPMRMMVGYDTGREFIIQDEAMFKAEKEYKNEQRMTRLQKIAKILSDPVNVRVEKIGSGALSQTLRSVAPNVVDYAEDSEYIANAIKKLASLSETTLQFLTRIADIDVYLKFGEKIKGSSSVFIKRVQQEYYIPEILVDLSPSEMLPEVFDDPRVTEEEQSMIAVSIQRLSTEAVKRYGDAIYVSMNPTVRRDTYPTLRDFTDYPEIRKVIREWKGVCVNSESVASIADEELIYYEEADDDGEQQVYCLHIPDIRSRFTEKDFTNPYSGRKLSQEFITRFTQLYTTEPKVTNKEVIAELSGDEFVPPPVVIPELAPGLLDILLTTVDEEESELRKNDDTLKSNFITDESQSSVPIPSTEPDTDTDSDTDTSTDSESDTSTKPHSESDTSISTEPDKKTKSTKVNHPCMKCGKQTDCSIKSIQYNKNEPKTVCFCCFNCFESTDTKKDWPKPGKK